MIFNNFVQRSIVCIWYRTKDLGTSQYLIGDMYFNDSLYLQSQFLQISKSFHPTKLDNKSAQFEENGFFVDKEVK